MVNGALSGAEKFILNRYAASELAGSLILGKMARKVSGIELLISLTKHCMEEARHSFVWYELIRKLKISVLAVHDEGGDAYFSHVNETKDILEFLAFIHVFERRVPFHFLMHSKWTKNQMIRDVLEKLISEEEPHLEWIRNHLKREILNGNNNVKESLDRLAKLEKELYNKDLDKLEKFGKEGKEFVDIIKSNIIKFESEPKWWKE